jgi:hypothetical protein
MSLGNPLILLFLFVLVHNRPAANYRKRKFAMISLAASAGRVVEDVADIDVIHLAAAADR